MTHFYGTGPHLMGIKCVLVTTEFQFKGYLGAQADPGEHVRLSFWSPSVIN